MSEELPKACCSEKAESVKRTCECRHKATERSGEFQSELQKRLNRAIGQLNGVKSMIEDNRYCGDVLIQLSAAESAVRYRVRNAAARPPGNVRNRTRA